MLEIDGLPILKFLKKGLGVSGSEAVRSMPGRCASPLSFILVGMPALVGEPRGERNLAAGNGDLFLVGECPNSFRGGGERAVMSLGGGER